MSLSQEQKAFILKQLESQFNNVELNCDGYVINLSLSRYKMRLVVDIHINGWFKGEWLNSTKGHPETKYLPIKKRAFFTPKRKAEIVKAFGKRAAKKMFPKLDEVHESRSCFFTSPQAALSHLIKVSDSVELVGELAA